MTFTSQIISTPVDFQKKHNTNYEMFDLENNRIYFKYKI